MKTSKLVWRTGMILGLAALLALFSRQAARADTCTWDGGTGLWSDAAHWSCPAPPGGSDTAIIPGGIVSVESDTTVANLTFSGGEVSGSAVLTVTGTMEWTGGWLHGSGTLVVASGADLNISGAATKTLGGSRTLHNQGTVHWTGTGVFNITQNAPAVILNDGLFDAQNDAVLGSGQLNTTAAFHNNGTFRKSAGSSATLLASILTFNNHGTVQVQSGRLDLDTGATSTSSGAFDVSAGAVLEFSRSTHDLAASSAISGAGEVRFSSGTVNIGGNYTLSGLTTVSGGSANFDADNSLPDLDLVLGNLGGSGTLTITNSLDWTGGWMDGTGTTLIPAGVTLNASGAATKTLAGSRTLHNQGTVAWSGTGAFSVNQNAPAVILNEGLFDVQTDGVLGSGQISTTAAFNNHGTFRKSAGGGTALVASILTFNNHGTVQVQSGTLQLQTGQTSTSSGAFEVSAGATLRFSSGTHVLEAASDILGAGEVRFGGSEVQLDGGYHLAGQTTIEGGALRLGAGSAAAFASLQQNGGMLDLGAASAAISGDFNRSSGFFLGGTSTFSFTGVLTQTLAASVPTAFYNLQVEAGAILVESVAADNVTVMGALHNAGTIRKSKTVAAGANTFGLTGVALELTQPGTLVSLLVERVSGDHPQASFQTTTGQYWRLTPDGAGYLLDLTLPHQVAPDTNAVACRYTGSGTDWDCDRSASTPATVTRAGVNQLSDWAVGDAAAPGFPLYFPAIVVSGE